MKMRQVYRHRVAGRRGWKRAAVMLEFAFVLPIFLFLLLFTIDMGQVILMSGAMQDATFSAARAGAQIGGAGYDARTGTLVCNTTGRCTAGTTYRSFQRAMAQIPFASTKVANAAPMTINRGARCTATGVNNHVALTATYQVRLVTPGLNTMLDMMKGGKGGKADGAWQLTSKAVARCEIVR